MWFPPDPEVYVIWEGGKLGPPGGGRDLAFARFSDRVVTGIRQRCTAVRAMYRSESG